MLIYISPYLQSSTSDDAIKTINVSRLIGYSFCEVRTEEEVPTEEVYSF
jgi:hypothetical protein